MTDETRARRGYRFWIAVGLVLAPLLYVLSAGPVCYLGVRFRVTGSWQAAARIVYAPVIWLHDNTPMKEPLEWYINQWEELAESSAPPPPPLPVPAPAP